MRIAIPVLAGVALLLLAVCTTRNSSDSSRQSTLPVPSPTTEALIAVDPRLLLLPPEQMIPGTFSMTEGSSATAQWSRNWDRDPSEAEAGGALRIGGNARLYLNVADATADFNTTAKGGGGQTLFENALMTRGFSREQIKITSPEWPAYGLDDQMVWRAEFSRGSEGYVEYWVYLQARNTRVLLRTVAPNVNRAEAPKLLEETREVARRQAEHLRAISSLAAARP